MIAMLTEGETYPFRLYKTTVFPDGEEYYLLESPFKSKHLLSKKLYLHYNFSLNQVIKCKIDKINCSSRIFLEPEHPIYNICGIYEMSFVRNNFITNSKGIKKYSLIMQDKDKIEYICIADNTFSNLNGQLMIKFKLLRIKKGIFYIHIL